MKTLAYTIDLQDAPESISLYKEYHKDVWPEVIESNLRLGVRKCKIFLFGTRVVMIMETEDWYDPEAGLRDYASGLREKEWDALMRSFQKPVVQTSSDIWWSAMEIIFDMDEYTTVLSV